MGLDMRDRSMIARTWIVEVDPARADAYEKFAREVSVPMFKQQVGCRGVLMTRDGQRCQVISLWADRGAVDALCGSPTYEDTVAAIQALGILSDAGPVALAAVHELEIFA